MHCPVCNHEDTKVVDSRSVSEGLSIRRRRECEKCAFRFSTYEQIEILDLTVLKSNDTRESYSRDKLIKGLEQSLQKRPHKEEAFHMLVSQIERAIQKLRKSEVESRVIGEIVMKHLKKFDKIAYIRFASVYRAFEDMAEFEEEVSSLIKKKKTSKKK